MKRFVIALALVISAVWAADARFPRGTPVAPSSTSALQQENFFGLTGSAWQTPSTYYVPGTGNPAVSTADYYHTEGVYWLRPYDLLDTACGSAGSTAAAANGRYVWFMSPDHSEGYPWADGVGIRMGFSNDPGVPPATMRTFSQYAFYNTVPLAQIAAINASFAGTTMTVNSVASGKISADSNSFLNGTGVTANTTIVQQLTGTAGGTGTYEISPSQTVSSRDMTVSFQQASVGATPFFACNPDDGVNTFYVWAEGGAFRVGNTTAVLKSNDLVTWTDPSPAFFGLLAGSTASYQQPMRIGTNSWVSGGIQFPFPETGNLYGHAVWTSSNASFWIPAAVLYNICIPMNTPGVDGYSEPCTNSPASALERAAAPMKVSISGTDWGPARINNTVGGVRSGSQWIGRAPVDSNYNWLASPTAVNVSAAYAGLYPGPTYVNEASAYLEDGILHYYSTSGFPPSSVLGGTVDAAPYSNGGACNIASAVFEITNASISGTTLTVGTTPPYPLLANQQILYGGNAQRAKITGQLTGPAGGAGTYSTSISQTIGSSTMGITTCGGLWQQGKDYHTEIIDPTAAATAAPIGVRASCASSTASLIWYNALPQSTYRLYRGTTAGSQTTLVGDFSGTTATDTGMSLNAVTYYKLVYLHNGVEQKNRVVSTYCSSSIYAEVNAHLTRAAAAGADMTTCNRAWMDTFYGWLYSNSLQNNLLFATSVEFCVAKSGSVISKIFDMGTTRLPRGGDYTPLTSNTTYSATGINSNPSWVNTAGAFGAYGGGRANQIRRKTQITFFAAYQKPGTGLIYPFYSGQVGSGVWLSHTAGTPGAVNFRLFDATQTKTATATITGAATDFHTIAGTFDGTDAYAWADGVAGSAQTGLVIPSPSLSPTDALTGQVQNTISSGAIWHTYISGTDQAYMNPTGAYVTGNNNAQYNGALQLIFDKALSGAQMTSLNTLVRTHYGL